MLRNLLRFSAVATGAFFCLATSIVYDTVEEITPLPGETGVSVDEIPTVRTFTELDLAGAQVSVLREDDQVAVAGEVVQDADDDGYPRVRFVPAAPLDADTDYRFIVENALDGYGYYDPITAEFLTFGTTNSPNRLEVPFSTRSEPQVRHTRRYDGHAHLYLSFTQDMDPDTLSADTITVALDGIEEPPLAFVYEGGPAHRLKITMRRVDFYAIDVIIRDGVLGSDGTQMQPQTLEVEISR